MRKTTSLTAFLCMMLAGCALEQQHQQRQAFDTKGERLHAYLSEKKPLMDSGKLKKSVYYSDLYKLLNQPPVGPVDAIYSRGTAKMIGASRQLEAGQITPAQFDAVRRDVNIESQKATAQLEAREQAKANGKQ